MCTRSGRLLERVSLKSYCQNLQSCPADGRRNIGVLQTTVGELVTVKEHQRELPPTLSLQKRQLTSDVSSGICGYAVGLVHRVSQDRVAAASWTSKEPINANGNGSSIVGPMIGGALAKPVENLPSVFAPGSIWDRFPYLLPNLFSAICVFVGVAIGLLFLEETHAERKKGRDRGVELGNYLLAYLPGKIGKAQERSAAKDAEEQPLLAETEESLPGYLTNGTSAGPSAAAALSQQEPIDFEAASGGQVSNLETKPVTRIFTKPVITIIASYGILAL